MERLAQIISNKISCELGFDEEKRQVVTYGLVAILQFVITVSIICMIGIFFNTLIESLFICFSVSLLRRYSGGAHLNSIELCTVLSIIYSTIFAILCKYFFVSFISTSILIIILIVVFLLSFFAVYKLAPVDSPNKPIKTKKKRDRMRKGSYLTLSVFFVISVTFLILGKHYNNFNSYLLSILFGILWQVFTLTKKGHGAYNKFNFILHKIN
jgi:accessory gene regulator B